MTQNSQDIVVSIIGNSNSSLSQSCSSISINVLNRPSSLIIRPDHPAFFRIIQEVLYSFLNKTSFSYTSLGNEIVCIKNLPENIEDEVDKYEAVKKSSLWMYKYEIEIPEGWGAYYKIVEEEKLRFWGKLISSRMKRLKWLGYDPYFLFAPEVLCFWKSKESNIREILLQLTMRMKLDKAKIDSSINKLD